MESFIKQFTQNIFERTKESLTSKIPEAENLTIIQIRQKMDKFEIPFIPQEIETSKPEAIFTTENMREFSNFDIEAALILSRDNLEIARKESKYSEQASKAIEFVNKILAKHNQDKIFQKIKLLYSLPDHIEELNISLDRGPHKQILKTKTGSIYVNKKLKKQI